ncbi:hypothetical protein EVAR_63387_1 [Eumeta japonica]|uniref:Uncharacterized protein n=1 Tax=Eumeta variegata TaxID=151549 RepID=A0A4C1YVS8_EUMVA|nr:hypothetical protein EVAR_63387_1 [Eumeta japonica]
MFLPETPSICIRRFIDCGHSPDGSGRGRGTTAEKINNIHDKSVKFNDVRRRDTRRSLASAYHTTSLAPNYDPKDIFYQQFNVSNPNRLLLLNNIIVVIKNKCLPDN